jgi:hypothetical protein
LVILRQRFEYVAAALAETSDDIGRCSPRTGEDSMIKDWLPDVIEQVAKSFDWFPDMRAAHRLAILFGGLIIAGLIAIVVVCVTKEPLDTRWRWLIGAIAGGGVFGIVCSLWYAATHEE